MPAPPMRSPQSSRRGLEGSRATYDTIGIDPRKAENEESVHGDAIVTAYPAWTPASRPGIIPLHPLSFGTILGRSFAALRQNPRVLLGFALGVQTLAYILMLVGVGAVAWATFSRLDTVVSGSEDFDAIMAGSIALTAITALLLGFAASAFSVIVQGVVVSEVAHAAVAEKLPLSAIWRRVRPVAWRLIGYTFLLLLAITIVFSVVAGLLILVGTAVLPLAIVLGILVVLAAIPLSLWLTVKLLLVPAIIILEHARIRDAVPRSWRLIRGRFWSTLGIVVIVSMVFGALAQAISVPFSLLTSGVTTIISPTGDPNVGAVVGVVIATVLLEIVTLLIQSIAVVVQSTASALVYIDCRMRHEGLDLDLLSYVERRDAGTTGLPDPYRENIGRVVAPRSPAPGPYAPYPAPAYTAHPYATQPYPSQPYATQPYPTQPPPSGFAPVSAPAAEPVATEPTGDAPASERSTRPAPRGWTAPGQDAAPIDPDSPWS